MASPEPMDLLFRLRFDAAILDHVAKKTTSKRQKAEVRRKAAELRESANAFEALRNPNIGKDPAR